MCASKLSWTYICYLWFRCSTHVCPKLDVSRFAGFESYVYKYWCKGIQENTWQMNGSFLVSSLKHWHDILASSCLDIKGPCVKQGSIFFSLLPFFSPFSSSPSSYFPFLFLPSSFAFPLLFPKPRLLLHIIGKISIWRCENKICLRNCVAVLLITFVPRCYLICLYDLMLNMYFPLYGTADSIS